ncbi:uncharacterized protein LOC128390602 [Panonychus citri]|uniref:uncharacterized protein LOC128390602 n=1 Tax=Panonychus citri TaxID=50023 RepID=UPI002307B1B1|nr:uncharacterized protein LOC128390602 [Panonychus citri]
MSNGSSFSLIAVSYNRNETDHIAVFPFNPMLHDFERPTDRCQTTDTFWKVDLFNQSGPECNLYQDGYFEALSIRKEFTGYYLTDILTEHWTRIVDFVPLALDATPGYVFLVLSSNSNFTRYRYSIHFVDENYSVSTHPNEATFTHPNIVDANETVSQIYYYGFTHPRAIITLNQYSYSESIILCPFLNNSCIDCFTTKVYNPNGNFLRYCQWRRGNSLTLGECSIGGSNSSDSRETTLTNQTVNPCFSPTNIQADYTPDEPTFNLSFDLLGFHSRYADIFPLTFTLVDIMTFSYIENCTVLSYNQSKIYLNCNWVNSGQYQLSILMLRQRGPFETEDIDNLITYSDPFTIGSPRPPSSHGSSSLYILLIILRVFSFTISVIGLIVFHYLLFFSLYFKTKTSVTSKHNEIMRNDSFETKSKISKIRFGL